MTLKDIFVNKARKYNKYEYSGAFLGGQRCINCVRWRLSYPYTCNDHDMYSKKAESCLNWTDDVKCQVD